MILEVFYPVPSLNRLFAMHHWAREKEKKKTQDAVLSALLVAEQGSAYHWTTFARSILSTHSRYAGIIPDDTSADIVIYIWQEKVKKKDEKTVIEITHEKTNNGS